ncbi:MAG: hypothetical protein QOH31_5044 [Verrucomicrobiota bacterium]
MPNSRCGSIDVLEEQTHSGGPRINIQFNQVRSMTKDHDPAAWIDLAGGHIADTPGASNPLHCAFTIT